MQAPVFTPKEKEILISALVQKTTDLVIARTLGMSEDQAKQCGAFDESAFDAPDLDKLYQDFVLDCFTPNSQMEAEHE